MFNNTNELKEKQTKGKSHLRQLSDAVDYITKKFDKYKQERKERKDVINNLTKNVPDWCRKQMTSQKLWKSKSKIQGATACYCMKLPEKKQDNTDEFCTKA